MPMMWDVATKAFEGMLCVVADKVEAHEHQQNAQSKSSNDLHAFKSERMSDGGPAPDFKVAQHFHCNTKECAKGVIEDQMTESFHCGTAMCVPCGVRCDRHVCNGPVEADYLIFGHRGTAFRKGGNWQRVRESEGCSRSWLEEDLVRYAGVLVFVASTLANVLRGVLVSKRVIRFMAWACSWA
jgi:hypothetical protein